MKLITKMIAGVVAVATVLVLGNYVLQYFAEKNAAEQLAVEKEAYMKKVVSMVKHPNNAWVISTKLPENPVRIQWDAQYEMPRVMFLGKRQSSDDSSSLWSMNLDGSDIKLMISNDEIKNMRMRRLVVSPDGRYLFANSEYRGFMYKCYLYDLKEQKATYISKDRCTGVHWIDDANNAIVFNGYGPAFFTISDKKLQRGYEMLGEDIGHGINSGSGSLLSYDGTKYIRATTQRANRYYNNGDSDGEGDFIVYDAKTFRFINKLDYYPKGCDNFIYYSIDNSFFTCNKIKKWDGDNVSYTIFNAKPPFDVVGDAPALGILQLNTLYTDYGHFVYRRKKPEENTPIQQVKYWYEYDDNTTLDIFFYLSPNLRPDYHELDFTPFYPPMPTVSQVAEAKRRIKES